MVIITYSGLDEDEEDWAKTEYLTQRMNEGSLAMDSLRQKVDARQNY